MATSRRPKLLRRSATTNIPTTANMSVVTISNPASAGKSIPSRRNGSLVFHPKIVSGGTRTADEPKISGCPKNTICAIEANAMEASARYNPFSRSAGSAISTPKGTANSAATSRPVALPRSGPHL